MKRAILPLAVFALALMGCLKEGPTGPAGDDGVSPAYAYTGILFASSAKGTSPNQYWDIFAEDYFGACIVDVKARLNSGQMWQQPEFYLGDAWTVRILGSEWSGYEYRIRVICGELSN